MHCDMPWQVYTLTEQGKAERNMTGPEPFLSYELISPDMMNSGLVSRNS